MYICFYVVIQTMALLTLFLGNGELVMCGVRHLSTNCCTLLGNLETGGT